MIAAQTQKVARVISSAALNRMTGIYSLDVPYVAKGLQIILGVFYAGGLYSQLSVVAGSFYARILGGTYPEKLGVHLRSLVSGGLSWLLYASEGHARQSIL